MPRITIILDPGGIQSVERIDVPAGVTLADWLIERYGPDGFQMPTAVYAGGIAPQMCVDLGDFAVMSAPIERNIFIVHQPLGLPAWAGYALASLVVAVAVATLMPVPELPSGTTQGRQSPNNALSGQTNVARLGDRVPEIFGQVDSYPDLIAPTVVEYVDHIKRQIEYMAIGRGYYDIGEFFSGDTPLLDIPGASVTVYEPGAAPVEVLKTRTSNEVTNQHLLAPNQVAATTPTQEYGVSYTTASGRGKVIAPTSEVDPWDGFGAGDVVNVTDLNTTVLGESYNLDGQYEVFSVTSTEIEFVDADITNANWLELAEIVAPVAIVTGGTTEIPGATYTVVDGKIEIPDATYATTGQELNAPLITQQSEETYIGPVIVPGTNNDQVWIDLQGPKGLAWGKNLDKAGGVGIDFLFEAIDSAGDPTGPGFTRDIVVTGSDVDPKYWTFKITSSDGLVQGQRYRVTGYRTSDAVLDDDIRVVEEIRWTRLAGIEDIAAPDTTGTTRVVVNTMASEQQSQLQERKFHADVVRRVVTWDGTAVVGDIDTGAGLVASRRMADAFLHYCLDQKLSALSISAVDAAAIYSIQSNLDAVFSGKKGEFSYTFDGDSTPALEEMRQIAQAARCFLYREGSVFSMTRDEAQQVSVGMFNRRAKLPDSESRSVRFNRPLDNDGVQIEYSDIDEGALVVLTFPDDLPSTDDNYGLPSTLNPLKIEGAGIRQYYQAWDRAQYEFRKLINQRISVESTVTGEAVLLPLNARIQHVDGTRISQYESNGEIKAFSGVTATTSERCDFSRVGVYSVTLRDDDGTPASPIVATARTDTEFGFVLASPPPFPIATRTSTGAQRGTLYSLGPDGNDVSDVYLVQRKTPDEVGNVQLELINYSPEYYAADDTEPPPRVTS